MTTNDVDGNIEWTQVRRRIYNGENILVIEVDNGWVCCSNGKPEAVINWSSSDADEAQAWLKHITPKHAVYNSVELHSIRKRYQSE